MSTLSFGALTAIREATPPPGTTVPGDDQDPVKGDSPTGMKSIVDTLAALVPAEVLAFHALVMSNVAGESTSQDDKVSVTITDLGVLQATMVAGVVLAILFFVAGRFLSDAPRPTWDRWDTARAAIPPVAFVAWTMAQPASAFDSVAGDMSQSTRFFIAILGSVVLGLAAAVLTKHADARQVAPAPPAPPAGGVTPPP